MKFYKMKCVHAFILLVVLKSTAKANELLKPKMVYYATINITYKDPSTNAPRTEKWEDHGQYGSTSRVEREEGVVVHVRTRDDGHHACSPITNKIPSGPWIALVQRGNCQFKDKIKNAAVFQNASAVVIYNNSEESIAMLDQVPDVVSVLIDMKEGKQIAQLVDRGARVYMVITVGKKKPQGAGLDGSLNRTSVLFVSISFIVLLIISLAWLIFYYIQRFRYAHAKERLSKRLMHAAKKAISKMPMKTLKSEEMDYGNYDQCAVCIEEYGPSDVIRILPCKHFFHKSCVDPWLIDHRSCPMCKLDILKAYGLQIHNSEASLVNLDLERGSTSVGASDVLHALDSGLTEDADPDTNARQHRVEMVCYHGLPSITDGGHSSGTPQQNVSAGGDLRNSSRIHDTDSSSDDGCQPKCTRIEPDIHCSGLGEQSSSSSSESGEECSVSSKGACADGGGGSDNGEQMALLPQCTCTPAHTCTTSTTTNATSNISTATTNAHPCISNDSCTNASNEQECRSNSNMSTEHQSYPNEEDDENDSERTERDALLVDQNKAKTENGSREGSESRTDSLKSRGSSDAFTASG